MRRTVAFLALLFASSAGAAHAQEAGGERGPATQAEAPAEGASEAETPGDDETSAEEASESGAPVGDDETPAEEAESGAPVGDDETPAEEALVDEAEAGEDDQSEAEGTAEPPAEEDPLPAAHRPALTLEIDTGEDGVRTGDLVRVIIQAEVPDGDDVQLPEQELGALELFEQRITSEVVAGGARRRFRVELDLLALEPGAHEVPAIALRVVTADGEVGAVRTEARTVDVASHIANEPDAQPKPPTEPVKVFEEDYTLLWVLLALAVLALVALLSFFAARWWTRRAAAAKPPPPPRPPWEVAVEKLGAIRREKTALIAENKQVELVDRVSDVVREYLGGRYAFNGLESTTDEVVARLRKVKLRGVKLREITALLGDSDLVKFARAVPDEAQCERMLDGAMHIVRATTPRPDAIAEARPPSEGRGARVVTEDGAVTLPISAQTIEEAEREIRAAVQAAFREVADDPSFDGTIRVVLSPELAPSATTRDALRRLQARISSELETMPLSAGRRAHLTIEHFHERLKTAADEGRAPARSVIDDAGVRVDRGAPRSKPTPSAEPPTEPASPNAEPPAEPSPASEPAGSRMQTGPVDWAGPERAEDTGGARDAGPREAGGRTKTGPVEWDRGAVRAQADDVDAPSTAPSTEPSANTSEPDPRLLERLLPAFAASETRDAGVLLRWVTGVERPVAYFADGEPMTTSTMMALGLTRGDVHERALANLQRAIPNGFAPGAEPALLDDEGTGLLALPALVPPGQSWVAYPLPGEGLVVMREDAPTTPAELERLERTSRELDAPLFTRPVRISARGFAPLEWPSSERASGGAG